MSRSIAEKVKGIISERGLKQYAVAEKCGYTSNIFNNLLNGRKRINEDDIFNLCRGLEIRPNELFDYIETEQPES